MTEVETVVSSTASAKSTKQFWSRAGLLQIAGAMLAIAIAWRVADIFVLRLGETWVNILPSKVFPFLIMTVLFWKYRRGDVGAVLGLNGRQFRMQLALGFLVGCSMYLLLDVVPTVIYGTFFDASYPLNLNILFIDILWYQFLFFFANALLEETLFRGLIQNGLRSMFTPNRAILLSATVFGLWHVAWPIVKGLYGEFSPSEAAAMLLFAGVVGVFFGAYYEKFSSRATLTGPIIAHTLINFLNECIKVGPDPSVQGPDITFKSPVLLVITFLFLVVTLGVFTKLAWSHRIEDLEATLVHLREKATDVIHYPKAPLHIGPPREPECCRDSING